MKKPHLIVGAAYEKESSCVEDVLAIAGAITTKKPVTSAIKPANGTPVEQGVKPHPRRAMSRMAR
jgi:hypothetical protein